MTDPDEQSGIPRVYFIRDIAKTWQVREQWIAERIRAGRFEAVKVGGKWAMTEAQMHAALESASNRKQRQEREVPEEERPLLGFAPRSWAYHQRWPNGNPNMRGPRRRRSETPPTPPSYSLPPYFKMVSAATPSVIAGMPKLSTTQHALLERVRAEGVVIVDGKSRRTVEALAIRDLVTYEAEMVASESLTAPGAVYRFTVRPTMTKRRPTLEDYEALAESYEAEPPRADEIAGPITINPAYLRDRETTTCTPTELT